MQTNLDELCKVCRLPLRKVGKKKGSLTAWMFASISCHCAPTQSKIAQLEMNLPTDLAVRPAELDIGSVIQNQYEILSFIGKGGMGSVYKVANVLDRHIYALKTLSSEHASESGWRRFQKEAAAASLLDHPVLVKVHSFGTLGQERPFFIMDYVAGRTMAERLKEQGTISLAECLNIFIPLCFGLGYAHTRGVIHRDLKPSNILLAQSDDPDKAVRLVDFGIARLVDLSDDTATLTQTGEIFGTPFYMSPEQCLASSVDHRSDIYSLGCVLYEALTGTPPFQGDTALSMMMKHQAERPLSLKEASLGKEFPATIEKVIAKLLEKKPENRYQSLYDVADDLNRIKTGRSVEISEKSEQRARTPQFVGIACGALIAGAVLLASGYQAGRMSIPSKANVEPVENPRSMAPIPAKFVAADIDMIRAAEAVANPAIERLATSGRGDWVAISRMARRQERTISCQPNGQPMLISDDDFRYFPDDKRLTYLDLSGTHIRGSGLHYLAGLPIEVLKLNGTMISDAALQSLKSLPKLSSLELNQTQITDHGLAVLASISSLSSISLENCKGVTFEALAALTNALPQCSIHPDVSAVADEMLDSIHDDIKKKKFAEALSVSQRIIKGIGGAHDGEANMRLFMALCYAGKSSEKLGNQESAAAYYEKAYDSLPTLPWAKLAHKSKIQGSMFASYGMRSDFVEPLVYLAGYYRDRKQRPLIAESIYKQALFISDRSADSHWAMRGNALSGLGLTYIVLKDYARSSESNADALTTFDKERAEPTWGAGVSLVQLGYLQSLAGKLSAAEKTTKKAIEVLSQAQNDEDGKAWSNVAVQQLSDIQKGRRLPEPEIAPQVVPINTPNESEMPRR